MAIETIGSAVRKIVRIKVPFRYIRLYIGHDSDGNKTTSHWSGVSCWHVRLTGKAYIGMGTY